MSAKRLKYDWSATHIRALRRHLDMTQQEMSDELGVRQQTVSDWERGYHQPRGGMARLLTMIRFGEAVSPAASEEMYRVLSGTYWNDEALSRIPPDVQVAVSSYWLIAKLPVTARGCVIAKLTGLLVSSPNGEKPGSVTSASPQSRSLADGSGVVVVGELPRGLPPLAGLPPLNLQLVGQLAPGALAVAAIGLVEAMSIARSIAGQSGQRLDSNQEFVGQGLSNLATGFLSGYPVSGSFTRSAVNYDAGARTPLASAFSGLFVLVAMLVFGPLAAYVPRTALAGVLILTAYSMIDRQEIARIWRGARADAVIMVITFLGTLFLPLEFAVLAGILISFAVYIITTSVPRVTPVLPDENFRHFAHRPQETPCPQLAILSPTPHLPARCAGRSRPMSRKRSVAGPTRSRPGRWAGWPPRRPPEGSAGYSRSPCPWRYARPAAIAKSLSCRPCRRS